MTGILRRSRSGTDGGVIRMREDGKPSARTVLKACPCCCGEAGYREREKPVNLFNCRTGRIVCLDCGLQTLEAPVDGSFGVEMTYEDFAALWNRREVELPKAGYGNNAEWKKIRERVLGNDRAEDGSQD